MASNVLVSLIRTVASPILALIDFLRSPLRYHKQVERKEFLPNVSALFIFSGILFLVAFQKQYEFIQTQIVEIGDFPLSPIFKLYNFVLEWSSIPLVGEAFLVAYGFVKVLPFFPVALYLSSSRYSDKSFSNYVALMFGLITIGFFVESAFNFAFFYDLSYERYLEISISMIEFLPALTALGVLAFLLYAFVFTFNLKQFSRRVTWGRFFGAFLIFLLTNVVVSYLVFQTLLTPA